MRVLVWNWIYINIYGNNEGHEKMKKKNVTK